MHGDVTTPAATISNRWCSCRSDNGKPAADPAQSNKTKTERRPISGLVIPLHGRHNGCEALCYFGVHSGMLALDSGILIGLAGGYFVRECISRRRHAAARERMRAQELQLFYQKHPGSMVRPKRRFSI